MKATMSERNKTLIRVALVAIVSGLLLYFLMYKMSAGSFLSRITSALFPFMLGAFIAFLLKPLCNKLDLWFGDFAVHKIFRRRIGNGKTTEKRVRRVAEYLSIFVALITFIVVVTLLVWMIVYPLRDSIAKLRVELPVYIEKLTTWLEGLNKPNNPLGQTIYGIYSEIMSRISNSDGSGLLDLESIINNIFKIIPTVGSFISIITNFLINFLVTAVSSIYILLNRKRFAAQATLLAYAIFKKAHADWLVNEVKFANRKFTEFLTGKMFDSFLVGIILYIAFLIFRIPQAPLLAVFMAFCNMIPFFGPFIGAFPCGVIVLLTSLDNPFRLVIFIIIVLAVQQLDGNILDPFIVGDSIGLSSFWVLFAVILFGDLFGFFGMLLGVPIFAVIYDIARQLINFGLKRRGEEQLLTNYNFIFHDPEEERAALKKRAAAIKAARKEARIKDAAEREEAMEREIAIAQAAAAARAEAEAEALAKAEAEAEALARAEAESSLAETKVIVTEEDIPSSDEDR